MPPETESTAPVAEVEAAPTLPDPTTDPADDAAPNDTAPEDADATADDGEDDPDYDPIEAAIQERVKLELERKQEELEQNARRAADQRIAEESRRTSQAAEANQLRDSFVESLRESYTAIKAKKFYDQDGAEVQFSDADFQEHVAKPMQKHNSVVREIVQGTVLAQLADTALATLADSDARSKFTEEASGKPLNEWLDKYAETRAAGSQFVKKLQQEIEAKVKAAEARGFAKGQKRPVTTPKQGTERVTPANNDTSTITGLVAAHRAGQVSDDEFAAQWKKLRS